jgi:glucosylceramidase
MRTLLALASAVAASAQISVIQSSSAGDQWRQMPSLTWGPVYSSPIDVTVDRSQKFQQMMGFGAAFTDTSAFNIETLAFAQNKAEILEAYWGQSGLGYTLGRVTLNSADYSVESFNYDNVTNDFSLSNFDSTLGYDRQRVMPLLRDAQATLANWTQDKLWLFASPWSPPGWMKNNGKMINSDVPCLKNDTSAGSYKQAWANYIVKWLQGYEAAGLPMSGLTPQNEPMAQQSQFESCAYTVDGMVEFVGNYLGPAVKAAFPDLKIMAYDHNKIASYEWANALMSNANSAQYISGTAVHWYDYFSDLALDNLTAIHALDASKFMLNTEACFLSQLDITWRVGALYMADIAGGINFGLNGWMNWNHVLLSGDMYPAWLGGPNHDHTTDFGDPLLLQFNASGAQAVVYTPSYWIIGHFSRFARPGSARIATSGAGLASTNADYNEVRAFALGKNATSLPLMAASFLSADASTVSVVVANANDYAVDFMLRDAVGANGQPRAAHASIPALAIQTYSFAAQ